MPGKRISEPPSNLDGMSDGNVIVGDRPRSREAAERIARQQNGLPPEGAREVPAQPAAPSGLPFAGDARRVANREWDRLRGQAAGLEREVQRPVFGAGGNPVPYLLEQRQIQREALDQVQAQMAELEAIIADDGAVRQWAYEHGVR